MYHIRRQNATKIFHKIHDFSRVFLTCSYSASEGWKHFSSSQMAQTASALPTASPGAHDRLYSCVFFCVAQYSFRYTTDSTPSSLRRDSGKASHGGKRRNSHHSTVFGKAGNGAVMGISELVAQMSGACEHPAAFRRQFHAG